MPVNHTFGVKLRSRFARAGAWLLIGAVTAAAAACVPPRTAGTVARPAASPTQALATGSSGRSVSPAERRPATSSSEAPAPVPTSTPRPVEDRAGELMWSLFNLNTGDFFDALNPAAVGAGGNLGYRGLIVPVIEVSRFAYTNDAVAAVQTALQTLTGERYAGDDFNSWYAWLGRQRDLTVIPGYDEWKGEIYAPLDSRFKKFFYSGVSARVPLYGAVWGGVRVDGIPPLNDPKFISADEAGYLLADDVVLGVEINGDVRAYPHRILAWHELSNDVVGGRPVTLVY
ncbi:MAG: DUF3179 domain-containing protein [Chloroflexi bacterium]|nr:DUF3179 domain-containing protein [Chloroflexota bacterium]